MSRVRVPPDLRIDLTARQQFLDVGGEPGGAGIQFGAQALEKAADSGLVGFVRHGTLKKALPPALSVWLIDVTWRRALSAALSASLVMSGKLNRARRGTMGCTLRRTAAPLRGRAAGLADPLKLAILRPRRGRSRTRWGGLAAALGGGSRTR